jgi:UDP-glucose 4-epimerase
MSLIPNSFFIVGGAGFIGSHFCDELLRSTETTRVTVFDNFSSGREWHIEGHRNDPRFRLVRADIRDDAALAAALEGHETVIHLASNPDIAKAMTDPDIDYREGTALTRGVLEAMRRCGTKNILYASGSGVYGEDADREFREDHGPLLPISTYGASKLAGEALICAYAHMFDIRGSAFRFGNVVGPRQTHGIGFDFVRRLLRDPTELHVMGNGTQSKSYVAVSDVVAAVLCAFRTRQNRYEVFNVATGDYITVREIATIAVELVCGADAATNVRFGNNDRGWQGDVPIIKLNTARIRSRGWKPRLSSRDAITFSIKSLRRQATEGLLT